MGALIMLGSLFGLIALVFALVWRFDPEARNGTDSVSDV
jgi:flagellar biogenesis protein FliO